MEQNQDGEDVRPEPSDQKMEEIAVDWNKVNLDFKGLPDASPELLNP